MTTLNIGTKIEMSKTSPWTDSNNERHAQVVESIIEVTAVHTNGARSRYDYKTVEVVRVSDSPFDANHFATVKGGFAERMLDNPIANTHMQVM